MAVASQSFVKNPQIDFRKKVKQELQARKNFLSGVLTTGENGSKAFAQTFGGRVDFERVKTGMENIPSQLGESVGGQRQDSPFNLSADGKITDNASKHPLYLPTPDITFPPYRRRVSTGLFAHVRVAMGEVVEKTLGMTGDAFRSEVARAVALGADRERLLQHIESFTRDSVENPVADTNVGAARRTVAKFPVGNNFIPVDLAAGTSSFYLSMGAFDKALADMADACEYDMMEPPSGLENVNAVVVASNAAWAAFLGANQTSMDNMDFIGEKGEIDGMSVRIYKNAVLIGIPSRLLPKTPSNVDGTAVSGPYSVGFGRAAAALKMRSNQTDGYLQPATALVTKSDADAWAGGSENDVLSLGMHKMFFIHPRAFDNQEWTQFKAPAEFYEDKDFSLSGNIYSAQGMDTVRNFDKACRVVHFQARNDSEPFKRPA